MGVNVSLVSITTLVSSANNVISLAEVKVNDLEYKSNKHIASVVNVAVFASSKPHAARVYQA